MDRRRGLLVLVEAEAGPPLTTLVRDLSARAAQELKCSSRAFRATPRGAAASRRRCRGLLQAAEQALSPQSETIIHQNLSAILVAVTPDSMAAVHVGDSRLYLYHARELTRLFPADRGGAMDIEASHLSLAPGDIVLAANRGFTRLVSEGTLAASMWQHADPASLADRLIEGARSANETGNVALAVIGMGFGKTGGAAG